MAPQHGTHAGQKFVRVEGLEHVVIGTGGEPRDAVLHGISRGDNHDWQLIAQPAQRSEQGHAILLGQSKVEDRQVVSNAGH